MATFDKSETGGVKSDNQVNKHMDDLLNQQINSADANGEEVKDIPHDKPANAGAKEEGPMNGILMNFTQMLESMKYILEHMSDDDDDVMDQNVEQIPSNDVDDKDLMEELNKIFTPVLVNQKFEKDIADHSNEALSEAGVLTERNIIAFDDEARMSQLISVCALLLAKKKNTEKWQMFQNAANIKRQSKIDIQKEEYTDAKALAQKYLVMVSTTNNSSVARDAANDLLPQTQH